MMMANKTIGSRATMKDFFTNENFEGFNSSSREPSNTIRINPIVPKIGKIGLRLGILIPTVVEICLTSHPSNSNKITEGTLVFEEVISKT